MTFSATKPIGGLTMQIFASINAGEGYEWDIFEVLRHPRTGQFFVATDSGCSCTSLYDNIETIGDLAGPLNVTQVRRMCQVWENNRLEMRRGLGIKINEKLHTAAPIVSGIPLPRPAMR